MHKIKIKQTLLSLILLTLFFGCKEKEISVLKKFSNDKIEIKIEVSSVSKSDLELKGAAHTPIAIPVLKNKKGYVVKAGISGHPESIIDINMTQKETPTQEQIKQISESIQISIAPQGDKFSYINTLQKKPAKIFFLLEKGPLFAIAKGPSFAVAKKKALLISSGEKKAGKFDWNNVASTESIVTSLISDTASNCSEKNDLLWEAVKSNGKFDEKTLEVWPNCKRVTHKRILSIANSSLEVAEKEEWRNLAFAKAKEI